MTEEDIGIKALLIVFKAKGFLSIGKRLAVPTYMYSWWLGCRT